MKKILSFILAAVLVLGLMPSAFAAGTPSISASLDKSEVKAGEDVTFTLTLDEKIDNVMLAEFFVHYDSALLTYKSGTAGSAMTGTQVAGGASDVSGTEKKVSVNVFGYPTGFAATEGTIATLVFTANADITESTSSAISAKFDMCQDKTYSDITIEDKNATVSVTVAPKETVKKGEYSVTMSADKEVGTAGEMVSIPVTIGSDDIDTYNAFDMSFSYDESVLKLKTTEIADCEVTLGTGTVRVQRYGDAKSIGEAFTLTFEAVDAGSSDVTVTSAKISDSDGAVSANAPEAALLDAVTKVTVKGYGVTLSDDFTGAQIAEKNKAYTFEAKDKNYDYIVSATMGGKEVSAKDNNDGTFTIENITGSLVISATKEGKKYDVTFEGTGKADVSGNEKAQYLSDYTFTVTKAEGYTYEVAVTMGGNEYKGYSVSGDTYKIPGAEINGDIVVTVTKTEIPPEVYAVSVEGSGAGEVTYEATATEKTDYSFKVTKEAGYEYDVSAVMGGKEAPLTEENGTYTIKSVSGDIVITVEKKLRVTVEVSEYVKLDGTSMWLIKAEGTPAEGKAYTYGGEAMFWSEADNCWYFVVKSAEEAYNVKAAAEQAIGMAEVTAVALTEGSDVNMTGIVDINDAQLVYDIYNAKYDDFTVVSMQKFLNADVNGDGIVNVEDAAAVVNNIQ